MRALASVNFAAAFLARKMEMVRDMENAIKAGMAASGQTTAARKKNPGLAPGIPMIRFTDRPAVPAEPAPAPEQVRSGRRPECSNTRTRHPNRSGN